VTTQTASALGAGLTPAELQALRVEDQERWVFWLECDEADLRDETLHWASRYPGLTGTYRQCQDEAVAICTGQLEAEREVLAALQAQQAAATGETATQRPENGE
jgi:hypothetical protein